MKKKDAFKLGYDYAMDCGSENCTKSVLTQIYELAKLQNPNLIRTIKSEKSYYTHEYGDMKFNPFKEGSKSYQYFNAGALKAFVEMESANKKMDESPLDYTGWCFDNEIDTSYRINQTIQSMPNGSKRKRCQKLADWYDSGVNALMTLINDEFDVLENKCFDALFDSDKQVLIRRSKEVSI